MSIFNFLKASDNVHVELQRLAGFSSVVAGIGYSGIHLVRDHVFSIVEFGIGMGSLVALVGGGIYAKAVGQAKADAIKSDTAAQGGV